MALTLSSMCLIWQAFSTTAVLPASAISEETFVKGAFLSGGTIGGSGSVSGTSQECCFLRSPQERVAAFMLFRLMSLDKNGRGCCYA
mgnify:CR=1 FL=1